MNVTFRRMRPEDVPAVHEIDLLSFSLPWPERSFNHEVNENPAARCWVAEADGRIAAMLVMWLIVDEAHIATIATHPDFRRQGIGERLLLTVLAAAREEGARRAFLEVRAGNLEAQALYKKYGFSVDGVRPRYYKDNNEDAILMSLDGLQTLTLDVRTVNLPMRNEME
ncbi:MAG: ribosomal protein S18-alanine N-acetyltransferase [Chloroflexota bacterium]